MNKMLAVYAIGSVVAAAVVAAQARDRAEVTDWEVGLAAIAWPLAALFALLIGVGHLVRMMLDLPSGR